MTSSVSHFKEKRSWVLKSFSDLENMFSALVLKSPVLHILRRFHSCLFFVFLASCEGEGWNVRKRSALHATGCTTLVVMLVFCLDFSGYVQQERPPHWSTYKTLDWTAVISLFHACTERLVNNMRVLTIWMIKIIPSCQFLMHNDLPMIANIDMLKLFFFF